MRAIFSYHRPPSRNADLALVDAAVVAHASAAKLVALPPALPLASSKVHASVSTGGKRSKRCMICDSVRIVGLTRFRDHSS